VVRKTLIALYVTIIIGGPQLAKAATEEQQVPKGRCDHATAYRAIYTARSASLAGKWHIAERSAEVARVDYEVCVTQSDEPGSERFRDTFAEADALQIRGFAQQNVSDEPGELASLTSAAHLFDSLAGNSDAPEPLRADANTRLLVLTSIVGTASLNHTPAPITSRVIAKLKSVDNDISEVTLSVIAAVVIAIAAAFRSISRVSTLKAARTYLWLILTRRRVILLWVDAEHSIAPFTTALQERFLDAEIIFLKSPRELLRYPMYPRVIQCIVLLVCDVTKLDTSDEGRLRIDRRLQTYVMRGGAIVGSHDLIYRRTRNKYLQEAFGVELKEFQRVESPVRYVKCAEVKNARHPAYELARHLPDVFDLDDREIIWGSWSKDVEPVFRSEGAIATNLVTTRRFQRGRLVWLNTGDHRDRICGTIDEADKNFVTLVAASIRWSSAQRWDNRAYPYIVAHRGASFVSRENTLAAFEKAIETEADAVECDVRRTADGILILHHDGSIGHQVIAETSYDSLFAEAKSQGFVLASLTELLASAKGRIKLDIELKERGYEDQVAAMIREAAFDRDDIVVTSFLPDVVANMSIQLPTTRCGLLIGMGWRGLSPILAAKKCNAAFVAVDARFLRFGFATRLLRAGLPIWAWTVDDAHRIGQLLAMSGVEAVITNRPQIGLLARQELQRRRRGKT
jgi:glycerophosphoryl diester phosphodiesterase